MADRPRPSPTLVLLAAITAVLLAGLGTLLFMAASGTQHDQPAHPHVGTLADCPTPTGPGTLATFTAVDMGGIRGTGHRMGMMLMPRTVTVPAGQVTLALVNAGTRPHELLLLPLVDPAVAGQRTIGGHDRISETGSLDEAKPVCPSPSPVDGVVPGGTETLTLTLAPGTYEVLCNLPGHYRLGMYATLTVA